MAIAPARLGFFSEQLVQSMACQAVTAKALSIELGCSYEFVRRMIRAECLPSPSLLKRMCTVFRWNARETRNLVVIDRARRKFGRDFWVSLGKNPDYEPLYILWHFLSREEQEYFSEWLRHLVARKQRTRETGRLIPNQISARNI